LATGVLIVGVGKGTRELPRFLGCTKTYETVILFGKSTDTYDVAGKVVTSARYDHITKEMVEGNLAAFRGKIRQAPPIYSAIKVNGMKAYDYARSGKELPRELAPRDMEVAECKMLAWHEGGTHNYRWPAEEAPEEEKEFAPRLIDNRGTPVEAPQDDIRKRKTSLVDEDIIEPDAKRPKTEPVDSNQNSISDSSTREESGKGIAGVSITPSSTSPKGGFASTSTETTTAQHVHAPPPSSTLPSPAPACSISLTVSSGFYVRSFAHELGLACKSLGIMASLIRSRQGDFSLNPSPSSTSDSAHLASAAPYDVLSYDDLALGEGHWGPKVTAMLERWNADHPQESDDDKGKPRTDDRDRYPGPRDRDRRDRAQRYDNPKGFSAKRGFGNRSGEHNRTQRRDRGQGYYGGERRWDRRNTSSDEE
jgi:tRNA pseudouridine55 synthase